MPANAKYKYRYEVRCYEDEKYQGTISCRSLRSAKALKVGLLKDHEKFTIEIFKSRRIE